MMQVASADRTSEATIARTIGCAKCGYNLRSLSINARCPECNEPVADSIAEWDRRWHRALSPRRRTMLICGAMLMLLTGAAAQFIPEISADMILPTILVVLSCAGIFAIMTVRWDDDWRRWAGVPVATRAMLFVLAGMAITRAVLWRSLDMSGLILVTLCTHFSVLATTFFYIHVSRVANRLGWRPISWQALILAVLMAATVVLDLRRWPYEHWTLWMLPGLGARGQLRPIITSRFTRVDGASALLLIAVIAALLLMLQLLLAGLLVRRPKVLET